MNASDKEMSYLMGICCREDGFTLPQIVSMVINERPAKIPELARAWNELNRRGLVKIKRWGRPSVYELATHTV